MAVAFSLTTAMLSAGLGSAILTAALVYLTIPRAAPYASQWWAAGFALTTVWHLVPLGIGPLSGTAARILAETALSWSQIVLSAGTLAYCMPGRSQRWVLFALQLAAVWAIGTAVFYPHRILPTAVLHGAGGLLMTFAGWQIVRLTPAPWRVGHFLVGCLQIIWGLLHAGLPLLPPFHGLVPAGLLLTQMMMMTFGISVILMVQRLLQHAAQEADQAVAASQAKLRESELRFRDLIHNNPLGIVVHVGGKPIYANPAFLRLFGFASFADLTERDLIETIVDESEVPRIRRYVRQRMSGGASPEHYEFKGRRSDGAPIWLVSTTRNVNWWGQNAIQATLQDITQNRHTQDELRANQRLLRIVIDSIPYHIVVRDRNARILMANKAWMQAYQADPADYLHRTSHELKRYSAQDAREIHDLSLRVIKSEQPFRHEHTIAIGTAARRFESLRVPLRGEDGRVAGVVSISQDITEHRRMEEQLLQARKMEAVGQLTGGVAHDFNNLLSIILGNLELLRTRIHGDTKAQAFADRAFKATERGASLTQRLLAFARRQTLQPEPVSLAHEIEEMMALLRTSLPASIQIETAVDERAGKVLADRVQLENALLNLAFNARDAMPDGGTLLIRVAIADPDLPGAPIMADEATPWMVISVKDTGCGMPEHVLEHALEPFFTTKEAGNGSGLGLSSIYGFVKQSGGHLHIESTEGSGTTVRLYFPTLSDGQSGEDEDEDEEPAAPPRGTAETVLVVEDDPALGNVVVEMLSDLNYRPIMTSDGNEALRALESNPKIGLLFTDIMLPNGMDGVMLAETARRIRPELKILFTSGYADTVLARSRVQIPEQELVHKPYRMEELAQKVNAVLREPDQQSLPVGMARA